MTTVLYVTAHPGNPETSFSLSVGQAFVDAYKEENSGDEVIHLDLYNANVPQIDAEVLGAWGKLQSGLSFDQLSAGEQAKVARLGEIVDQFVAADKVVFVNPMWNFSFPPVLKAYIDAISVAGKTFKYTEKGPVGLMAGKKALHIQASGGVYSHGPAKDFEMGHRYLNAVMQFLGVNSFEGVFAEGMAAAPDQAPEIKEIAIRQARELAKSF